MSGDGSDPAEESDEGAADAADASGPDSSGLAEDTVDGQEGTGGPAPDRSIADSGPATAGDRTDGEPSAKLHPYSVPYRSLSRSLSTGSLFFFIGVFTSPGGGGTDLTVLAAMVAVGILVGIAYEFAYYQRFRYELTGDTFDVTSGVLSRRDREVPLRRVQNVDVQQNVLQRALGLAAVNVETAGGGETEVVLHYVGEEEAGRLQRRLRQGARDDDEDGEDLEAHREESEEGELLFEIQPDELAILSVFTIDPGASLLATIALSFASGFDPTTLVPLDAFEGDLPGTGLIALAWAALVFLLVAWIVSATLTFSRYYGFRLTRSDDELHYERGLLQRYSGTIPLDKVQTLTIEESIPFRWIGYGSLAVETAGYAPGQSGSGGAESAVPIAERDRVRALARSIEPFGNREGKLEPSPGRARERYAIRYAGVVAALVAAGYALDAATGVFGDWYVLAGFALAAPVAAHLKWRNRGFAVAERYFFARTGFWKRTTKVVPHYRIQSVVYTQNVFQRRRRLASVTADTASSAAFFGRAATAYDVDADRATELREELNDRLQERLRERKRHRLAEIEPAVDAGTEPGSDGDDREGEAGDATEP